MTPDLYLACLFSRADTHAHITRAMILGSHRDAPLVTIRHAMIHLVCTTYPSLSTVAIGHMFYRHHTAILHAKARVAQLLTIGDTEITAAIHLLTLAPAPGTTPHDLLIKAALDTLQDPRNHIQPTHTAALSHALALLTA